MNRFLTATAAAALLTMGAAQVQAQDVGVTASEILIGEVQAHVGPGRR